MTTTNIGRKRVQPVAAHSEQVPGSLGARRRSDVSWKIDCNDLGRVHNAKGDVDVGLTSCAECDVLHRNTEQHPHQRRKLRVKVAEQERERQQIRSFDRSKAFFFTLATELAHETKHFFYRSSEQKNSSLPMQQVYTGRLPHGWSDDSIEEVLDGVRGHPVHQSTTRRARLRSHRRKGRQLVFFVA